MRLFIGIDFSYDIKNQIINIRDSVKRRAAKGRWKHIDNFHLTLKFIGETPVNTIQQIDPLLERICGTQSKFKLKFDRIGQFPGDNCCRAVWLGVKGQVRELFELQNRIECELEQLGFEKQNRKYNPHITLGQDIVFNGKFDDATDSVNLGNVSDIMVDRIVLFNSEQIAGKRVYTPLKQYLFSGLTI